MLAAREQRKRNVTRLLTRVEEALGAVENAAARGGPGAISDLKSVLRFAKDTVERSEKALFTANAVEAFERAAEPLLDTDRRLSADEVSEQADALLTAVATLPGQTGRSFELELGRLTARHARSLGQQVGSVNSTVKQVEARANQVSEELAKATARLEGMASETDASLRGTLSELTTAIEAQRAEVAEIVTEGKAAWQAQLEELEAEAVKQQQARHREAERQAQEATERAAALVEELEAFKEAGGRLLSNVSVDTTAGRYAKSAGDQKREADRWRAGAVVLGGAAIIPAIAALLGVGGYEPEALLPKLVIALVLAGLARYAATQSSRHRTREERDEQVANDLSVFSAFIQALPEDHQNTERVEYARRLFRGREMPGEQSTAHGRVTLPDVAQLLGAVTGGGPAAPPAGRSPQ